MLSLALDREGAQVARFIELVAPMTQRLAVPVSGLISCVASPRPLRGYWVTRFLGSVTCVSSVRPL